MIHFIAGLPRSGSTLLRAILGQNPRVGISVSSPLFFLLNNLLGLMSSDNGLTRLSDEQRARVLKGLVEGVYENSVHSTMRLTFDTNRLWPTRIPLLKQLLPQSKIICCVRNPAWIIDSYERLYRKNPLRQQGRMFEAGTALDVYARAELLMDQKTGVIGTAWRALREAWTMERERLILVKYDELTFRPEAVLAGIYDGLGEARFRHDFYHVTLDPALYSEYDDRVGLPGLHQVGRTVKAHPRKSILPPDLFARYSALDFWTSEVTEQEAACLQAQ